MIYVVTAEGGNYYYVVGADNLKKMMRIEGATLESEDIEIFHRNGLFLDQSLKNFFKKIDPKILEREDVKHVCFEQIPFILEDMFHEEIPLSEKIAEGMEVTKNNIMKRLEVIEKNWEKIENIIDKATIIRKMYGEEFAKNLKRLDIGKIVKEILENHPHPDMYFHIEEIFENFSPGRYPHIAFNVLLLSEKIEKFSSIDYTSREEPVYLAKTELPISDEAYEFDFPSSSIVEKILLIERLGLCTHAMAVGKLLTVKYVEDVDPFEQGRKIFGKEPCSDFEEYSKKLEELEKKKKSFIFPVEGSGVEPESGEERSSPSNPI